MRRTDTRRPQNGHFGPPGAGDGLALLRFSPFTDSLLYGSRDKSPF